MKNSFNRQATEPSRAPRRGFTMLELVIVIVIILLISILILPSVLGELNDRKFSDTARTVQAVFLGARDRAVQSGNIVGVRLIRDNTDPFDVTQLIFVTVPEPFSLGRVTVSGTTVTPVGPPQPDPHFEQVAPGKDTIVGTLDDIPRVVPGLSSIRFDFAGKLYLVTGVFPPAPPPPGYKLTINSAPVGLTDPAAPHQFQVFGAPVPMAQADAIPLPDGIVIDVRGAPMLYPSPYSASQAVEIPRSRGIPSYAPPVFPGADGLIGTPDDIHWLGTDRQLGTSDDQPSATWPPMDILFGPNGQVTGAAATQPLIHLWIGERGDKGPDPATSRGSDNTPRTKDDLAPNRRRLLVTLNTRTGAIHVLHDPGTASLDNWPPATIADDYADIYATAEQSLGVSLLP